MMTLTHERLVELLSYDPETGLFRWIAPPKHRAGMIQAGSIAGHRHKKGYVRILIAGRSYGAHRLAWFYVHGVYPPEQIDHRDRVRHNNIITNLRPATRTQNGANSKRREWAALPFKGVTPQGSRFCAQISRNGRTQRIGTFLTAEEAHAAYCKAAFEKHGDFARAA